MSEDISARLRKLEMELEALQRIKTQEDFDEGARLHAIHNAPWVKGQYSHLEFKPYEYQEFPKAIYKVGYLEAYREWREADLIPAFGQNDIERKQTKMLAERKLVELVKKVESEGELRRWLATGEWFETAEELEARAKSFQKDIELAAAHRAYEDRNMGERARAHADTVDEQAEAFIGEIPVQRRAPGTRVVVTEAEVKAQAAKAGGAKNGTTKRSTRRR